MEIHLQGFFATMCGKPCGRYQGTHWKSSIAFVKPHSNLQLVREYSLWKRRSPDSWLNLHALFFGDRLCMFRGHFPEPTTEWLEILMSLSHMEILNLVDQNSCHWKHDWLRFQQNVLGRDGWEGVFCSGKGIPTVGPGTSGSQRIQRKLWSRWSFKIVVGLCTF